MYDYSYDVLFFRVKNREYVESVEIDNMVVDIDKEKFITGFQIFEASKITNTPKQYLRNIANAEFSAKLNKNGRIEIKLFFKVKVRNKVFNSSFLTNQKFKKVKQTSNVVCSV